MLLKAFDSTKDLNLGVEVTKNSFFNLKMTTPSDNING